MSKLKERNYFVKVLFWYQQQGGLYSQVEIPLDFKYLKDCEVFAERLNNVLSDANNETNRWLETEVKIEEMESFKERFFCVAKDKVYSRLYIAAPDKEQAMEKAEKGDIVDEDILDRTTAHGEDALNFVNEITERIDVEQFKKFCAEEEKEKEAEAKS